MKNVKTYLEEKRDSGVMPTLKELINKTKNSSYISFDIFDTLLKRNVKNPSDVFDLVQLKLGEKELKFKEKRIEAEQRARQKSSTEISLDDIYRCSNADNSLKNELKAIELDVERECLTVNPYMIDFFNYCVKHKNVYIISDMYLSSDFIEKILADNKITGYKKLYVSCKYGKTKRDGSLFKLYLNQNFFIM